MKILNCGLTGGHRDIMLKFLTRMVQVLQDPALAIRQKNEDINLCLDMEKSAASQKEVQNETTWKQHFYWFCYHSCAGHAANVLFSLHLRNMAALNYILYTEFEGKFQYGPPVHSVYKRQGKLIVAGWLWWKHSAFRIVIVQTPAGSKTDGKMCGGCTSEQRWPLTNCSASCTATSCGAWCRSRG